MIKNNVKYVYYSIRSRVAIPLDWEYDYYRALFTNKKESSILDVRVILSELFKAITKEEK